MRCSSSVRGGRSANVRFTSFGGRLYGVGMAALCRFADTTASSRLFQLFTEVNERARAFYGRLGFRPTGARQLVRPDEPGHWEEERALDL